MKSQTRVLAHKLAKPAFRELSKKELSTISGAGSKRTVIVCGTNDGYGGSVDNQD